MEIIQSTNPIPMINEIAALILISTGILFNLFGCLGLVRLPDVYNRLQSATKCVTLGTCSILLGVLVWFGFVNIGIKALVAIPLLFFTSTVGAHALAKGSYKFGIRLGKRSVHDDYEAENRELLTRLKEEPQKPQRKTYRKTGETSEA
jgi:multicomponent Na+:H+ antiporter subunit G